MRAAWMVPALLVACGPKTKRIEPMPCAGADGQVLLAPAEVALIGHLAEAPPALAASLRRDPPTLVVLTGDAVQRSTAESWAALRASVDGLAVSPLAGEGEKENDPKRRGFQAAWSGLGVQGMRGAVPWRAFDIVDADTRWRIVVLDADREAVGDRWMDQLFWLPKVVGDDGYDHLVLLASHAPAALEPGWRGPDPHLTELLELVREHADASRLVLIATGGTRAPAVVLPGGRWGEAWVTTGLPAPPAVPVLEATPRAAMAPGLHDALVAEFERRAGMELDGLRVTERFDPDHAPVAGWWSARFADGGLALDLHLADGERWPTVYTLRWTPSSGWRP